MNYGFVKVAAAVPLVQVADCFYNIEKIEGLMRQASEKGVQIIAFPELSVTGYTCLDLFAQQTLLDGAEEALLQLVSNTADLDILTIVGVPLRTENRPLSSRKEPYGVSSPRHICPTIKNFRNNAGSHLSRNFGNRQFPSGKKNIRWAATCCSVRDG